MTRIENWQALGLSVLGVPEKDRQRTHSVLRQQLDRGVARIASKMAPL